MIGIICAMSEERDALLKLMSDVKVKRSKALDYHGTAMDNKYYVGNLGNKEVALFHSGVGKVYAAIVTTQVIERVKPELVINLGCAGSLNEKVHVNDVVIGTRVADWDVDVPGWERSIYSDKMSFAGDGKGLKLAKKLKTKTHLFLGPIVSGDEFIYKKAQVRIIKKYFPESLCGEMEGCSVANTCYAYGINSLIIRSISDETLVNGNEKQFEFNLAKVADTAAAICKEIVEKY